MSRPPLLSLRDVAKAYWRGSRRVAVLDGACLEVERGEFVAVYGQRCSGKSTLLRLAAGLDAPDGGTVHFDGHDLSSLSAWALARLHRGQIGWVGRGGPRSEELPMVDYVGLPLLGNHDRRAARQRAGTVLERLCVADCAGARWGELSDTERSQVAIAHALVRDPVLLLVDDPTAGLDAIDRERVVGSLRAVADTDRIAVVLTVPELPSMLRAHRVYSLSDGRLLGPPRDPRHRGGTLIEFPGGERSA